MKDRFHRPIRDLRISVTDRCNFRCGYCMPAHIKYNFLPRQALLTFEEITTVARIFADLGVCKLRITGGEPLLRRDLPELIRMLNEVDGIEDIALTTNGFFLPNQVSALKEAGLGRVTVSLDSLDEETFAMLNGRNVHPQVVLDAIDAAADSGLPVKVNTVVQRGVNDHEILPLAAMFREKGHTLRFIEFMDVGNLNGWNMEKVVPSAEVVQKIGAEYPLMPVSPTYAGEVAERWHYVDGQGEIGLISSVTQPFCGGCTRARISASGELFTCLFGKTGHDLKSILRSDHGEQRLVERIRQIWGAREDRYSELRGQVAGEEKVEMFKIGG